MKLKVLQDMAVPLSRVSVEEHSEMEGVIGSVDGFLTPPAGRVDPGKVAMEFAQANPELVPSSALAGGSGKRAMANRRASSVDTGHVSRSPVGYHVQLQQACQGVPVYSSKAIVHMTRDRGVYFFTSDLTDAVPSQDVHALEAHEMSPNEALEALAARLPWRRRLLDIPSIQHAFLPVGEGMRLTWRIDISLLPQPPVDNSVRRSADWRAFVDVDSGEVLRLINLAFYAGVQGQGRVFCPNPVVALKDENLAWDAVIPDSAYCTVNLARLDGSGNLRGTYVDTTATTHAMRSASGQFLYARSHPGFVQVMGYYYVDQAMDWLRRRGWVDLFTRPLRVNCQTPMGDESKFLPSTWALYFGEGKVKDAEDASIILHELGHAIQEAQVPDWGSCDLNLPVRAMGEGFADWFATLFFAEERRAFHAGYVGDWDARGYDPPSGTLRRVDTQKTMADWRDEEHDDGEIWSAALWDLYLRLGGDSPKALTRRGARNTVVNLVLTGHNYLSDGRRETLTFQHGLQALLEADRFGGPDVRKAGPHDKLIRDVFTARGVTLAG